MFSVSQHQSDSLGHISGLRAVFTMDTHRLDRASPGERDGEGELGRAGEPGKDVLSTTWQESLHNTHTKRERERERERSDRSSMLTIYSPSVSLRELQV